jgi:hypothetical protein
VWQKTEGHWALVEKISNRFCLMRSETGGEKQPNT